ncbi:MULTISPECIES: type II toxin-antitoxin system Phd/YefM family antitoxin [Burkholderiaceae]|uniref:type II toxin-antitoxin system Phd/YefM family antitoxin n=1 Tax=Burkholderiaceae TaxID=119060 RepID=UPI000488C28B|nr:MULTISPECIES: type II toxin-antitoxin system Phd/YefM family antitoxin [Burkholderiaceae]
MPIRIQEVLPLSDASSQFAKLADDVVAGSEKVLTKNGEPFVALIDTRKLAYYRALEAEHRQRVVPSDIAKGLEDMLSGRVRSEIEFRKSVGGSSPQD